MYENANLKSLIYTCVPLAHIFSCGAKSQTRS